MNADLVGEPKVIFILGAGRSGSTLLGRLLNEVPGVFYPGELRYIWRRLHQGGECACGLPLGSCAVWGKVLDGFRDVDPKRVIALQKELLRLRYIPRLLRGASINPSFQRLVADYRDIVGNLYRWVASASGSSVIVDSSHWPQDAALLRHLPGIDAYLVQIVRDPRAVAFSWQRQKTDLHRFAPWRIALAWVIYNAASELVRRYRSTDRSILLRYEDLMADPRWVMSLIATLAGEPSPDLHFMDGETAVLGPNHTIWGNPDRFVQGEVRLKEDVEWKSAQPVRDGLLVTAITAPLLRHLGYRLWPGSDTP